MSDEIAIGVDGGGSRTTAVAAAPDGRLLAVAIGGGINYNNIGMDEARRRLKGVVDELLKTCCAEAFRFLSVGMSALDGPATAGTLKEFAGDAFPASKLIMDSDANAALYAATLGGEGTIVICGTGSMVQSANALGNVRVGGGWGVLAGDAGSGHQIAVDALRAATAAWDGIAAPTALCEEALAFFGADEPRSLHRENLRTGNGRLNAGAILAMRGEMRHIRRYHSHCSDRAQHGRTREDRRRDGLRGGRTNLLALRRSFRKQQIHGKHLRRGARETCAWVVNTGAGSISRRRSNALRIQNAGGELNPAVEEAVKATYKEVFGK